jgi:hypothetical protein
MIDEDAVSAKRSDLGITNNAIGQAREGIYAAYQWCKDNPEHEMSRGGRVAIIATWGDHARP